MLNNETVLTEFEVFMMHLLNDSRYGPLSDRPQHIEKLVAHLWEQANDWDKVGMRVAVILDGEVKCDVQPDSYHAKLEEMAGEIVTTLLTALIGPKPEEAIDDN